MIVYGCCVGDWGRFTRNVAPAAGDNPVHALSGQTAIATAYNQILAGLATRACEAVVLLHDDLEITDPAFEDKIRAALADKQVAVVGVVGSTSIESISWWNHDIIGHQRTDGMYVANGSREGEVVAVDGSIMVLAPWAAHKLRFSESYQGFHGYDVDFAMKARRSGAKVVVADIDTHHHTTPGPFRSPDSGTAWWQANAQWVEQWRNYPALRTVTP